MYYQIFPELRGRRRARCLDPVVVDHGGLRIKVTDIDDVAYYGAVSSSSEVAEESRDISVELE